MTTGVNARRRVVTASVHPGTVNSRHYDGGILQSFFLKYLLRTPDEAALLVMHALCDDNYIPGAHIDRYTGRAHLQYTVTVHCYREISDAPCNICI